MLNHSDEELSNPSSPTFLNDEDDRSGRRGEELGIPSSQKVRVKGVREASPCYRLIKVTWYK